MNVMKTKITIKINNMFKQFVVMFDQQQNINIIMLINQLVEHIAFVLLVSSNSSNFFVFFYSLASISFISSISFVKQLRAENVKYFDFEIKQKNEKKNEKLRLFLIQFLIIDFDKHVYYINVYIFIDRLKNLTKSHNVKLIINVFIFCFRDVVLMWYFMKLNDFERNRFRINDLKLWYITLIERFKIKTVVILNLLISNRYNLFSIRNIKFRI